MMRCLHSVCSRHVLAAAAVLCAATLRADQGAAFPAPAGGRTAAPGDVVESVSIQQNRFIPKETLLYYVATKPGEPYDANRLRMDFRRLWDTGFLDDILLDVRDGRKGKLVTFVVRERRRVALIDYRGSKAISTSAIEDKLKEKEAKLQLDTFFDLTKVRRVESIVRAMLMEAGRPFATVRHETKPVGGAGLQLSFVMDDGPKIRVGQVRFLGNRLFSDGTLRGAMKKIRQRGFWNFSWLRGATFTEERWQDDHTHLEEYYRNRGYVTATIGEPIVSYYDEVCGTFRRRPCKNVRLEIPVSEGERYRVGQIKFEGMTIFREAAVRRLVRLEPGEIYNWSRIKKAYDKLRDLYGTQGFFNWTPQTDTKPDPAKHTVDVTLNMQEDKRYYVGRIRIVGNDRTRDKVVRREIYLDEGNVFNTEALKMSIKRVNQLGYFKPIEDFPELAASPLGDDKVDVTIKVKEQSRNQFSLGGGVSGYDGAFFNSSFSSSNFLGMGETFEIAATSGARTRNYQLGISEPYFLDRPITAGISLYQRRNLVLLGYDTKGTAQGYRDQRTGASFTTGLPLSHWTRLFASYAYEIVNIQHATATELGPYNILTGMPAYATYGYLYDQFGKRYESRLTPSIVRNTVDNPMTPHAGSRQTVTLGLAGGPLAGTVNYVRPDVELVQYIPHTRHTALGLHLQASWIVPYGNTAKMQPLQPGETTQHDALPFYDRFALGGETQVRGFEYYSIPAQVIGVPGQSKQALRGDSSYVFNAEYYLDVFGPVRALAFFDAGATFLKTEPFTFNKFTMSTGVELRVIVPVVNAPVRLIFYCNPDRDLYQINEWKIKRYGVKFSVGTTF